MGTFYLNIIWHQHQPSYIDPKLDQLRGPWVRTHGTKDYYDMAALLSDFPRVHCTFNLTSSLLVQLEEYYLNRLGPFIDQKKNSIDSKKFLRRWKGKTDPWIDLALTPTAEFNDRDKHYLLSATWNALYISDVMLSRFPEYKSLKDKAGRREQLTEQELREVKFWFFLAYFDPDFLEKKVKLVDGTFIDLTDLVTRQQDGTYRLRKTVTENDCARIIVETYNVLSNIIPIHKKLMYNPGTAHGQIDVITTPFYHPILPLIVDTDIARQCQPDHPMPLRFHFSDDAEMQIAKARSYFKKKFGREPNGMWPAEGSVAEEIIPLFERQGISWLATDEQILARSAPSGLSKLEPYAVNSKKNVAVVFRDTALSDKIGFVYQSWNGKDAANDFIQSLLHNVALEQQDRLLTVILDGENAWEWYKYDNDGKEFLRTVYRRLSELDEQRTVITTTMTEYIAGNKSRGIPPHPITTMKKIERLHPGSWINANFDTWIGNKEKNLAWEYLRIARTDLQASGVRPPTIHSRIPETETTSWYAYKAWEEMYAAEGSDWFWWYGTNQYVPGGTKPFDDAFILHLTNIYEFAKRAGGVMPERRFDPISSSATNNDRYVQGTMKQGNAAGST